MATHHLTIPISDQEIQELHVGDQVFLSGVMVTGRDAAHTYIIDNFVKTGGQPPESEAALYKELKKLLPGSAIYHCGPVVKGNLDAMYDLPAEQWTRIEENTEKTKADMIRIGRQALDTMAPAKLHWGTGHTTAAMNRRLPTPKGYVNSFNPNGPVDHSVPTLSVTGTDGKLRAVLFGYACHNTTLSFYQWCGDYAGFAQLAFEEKHPEAVGMFFIGCGADSNPLPRRKVELAEKYGRMVADAVEEVLVGEMKPVAGSIKTAFGRVDLPFAALPSKAKVEQDAQSKDKYVRGRARCLLAQIAEKGKLDSAYSCPLPGPISSSRSRY